MALKVEIELWHEAVQEYEKGEYDIALANFRELPDSSRTFFNLGLTCNAQRNFDEALDYYDKALALDQYSSIGYFFKANAKLLLERYEEAISDYDKAFQYLRGNLSISYAQLGMDYTLYSCEIAYNRALCYSKLENKAKFKEDIMYAMVNKQLDQHNAIIPKAVKVDGKDCEPFLLPKTAIFRPAETKSKNTKKVDYLGKSKVVGSTDHRDSFTGFAGKQAKETANVVASPAAPSREFEEAQVVRVKKSDTVIKEVEKKKSIPSDKDRKKSKLKPRPITPPSTESSAQSSPIINDMAKNKKEGALTLTNQSQNQMMSVGTPGNFYNQILSNNMPFMHQQGIVKQSIPKLPLPPGRLKVKIHFHETTVILMKSDVRFERMLEKARKKFNSPKLKLRYRDEDDDMVIMMDQEDLDLARGYLGDESGKLSDRVELYASD